MVTLSQVRRLTVEARSDGADKVTRDLLGIAEGQRAVADTGVQMASSEDKVARSTLSVERQLQRLQGRIDPLYRATRDLDSSTRLLDRALAQGSITEAEYARTLGLVQAQYERTALAAKHRAEIEAAARSASAAAISSEVAALDALRGKYDPLYSAAQKYKLALNDIERAESAGALSAERAYQARLKANMAYGRDTSVVNARETSGARQAVSIVGRQTIIPDRASDIQAYALSLDQLRAKYSPLFAVIQNYKAVQADIRNAHAVGALSADEMTAALSRQRQMTLSTVAALKGMRGAAGAGRSVDYRNLSFQINDIITMGMMGASPTQIIASQGGQIFQALQMSRGGVLGGLKEVGQDIVGLAARFPMVTAGAAAAAAAMAVFYAATRDGMPSAEKALERHAELVKEIGEQYRRSGVALASMSSSSPDGVLAAYAKRNEIVLRARYNEAARDLAVQNRPMTGIASANDLVHQSVLAGPVDAFIASVRAGKPDVLAFQRAISEIYLDPTTPERVKSLALRLLESSDSAAKLALQLPQAAQAIDAASRHADVLAAKMQVFPEALKALADLGLATVTPYASIDQRAALAMGNATSREQRDDVTAARSSALAELGRQLEVTRQLDELGARAVMARTVSERAEIAALQARLQATRQYGAAGAMMPETIQAEAAARAQVAAEANASARRTLETAQVSAGQVGLVGLSATIAGINVRYAEMIRDATGATDAVAQLEQAQRLEIATATRSAMIQPLQDAKMRSDAQARALAVQSAAFGQSAETVGYLNEKLALYNEYLARGVDITPSLTAAIEEQSRAAGRNAEMQDRMNKAQADAINRMDGFRSASKSAIGSLINGDWSSALSSFSSFFVDQFATQLTQGLLGRDGEAGGGLFGGSLMGLFGGGATRGASASNPVYVSFGDGGLSALLGGTGKANGLLSAPLSAANANSLGVVGGIDALAIYRKAVSDIESSGNYNALGPLTRTGDRAYGAYQVMGANIPSWTKTTLGYSMNPQQFLGSSAAQDAVFNRYFGSFLSKFGNANDAASMWFTGRPLSGGAGLADVTGTTGSVYVDRFNQALGRATNGLEGFTSASKTGGQTGGINYPASLSLTPSQVAMMPAGVSPYGTGWATEQLSGLSGVFQQLTNGLGGMVDRFLPGFGSVLTMLLNGMGSGGGSGLFGLLGGLFSGGGWGLSGQAAAFGLYANGGVPPGGISAYRNTVVSRPTLFAFANGAGLMGEAGEEGILPLRRNGRGQLGVYATMGPAEGAGGGTVNLSIGDVHVTVPEGTDTKDAAKIGASFRDEITRIIDSRLANQLRSGGLLSRSAFR